MAGKRKPPTGLGEKNKGPKGAAASTTASSAATMETMLDESMRGMKVDMANKILQDNDPEVTKREKKKDKKKKKKKKSSSSSSESSDECAQIGLEELQLQCGLKPKHLGLRDLVRIDDLKPEQIVYIIAHPSASAPFMTVMDLFEIGGELTGLRRKETQKTKKGEGEASKAKELAQQIERATESKWKGRLIKLLKLLADKNGKSTMCNFENLQSLRTSIVTKIQSRIKQNPDLAERARQKVQDLKDEATQELEQWNVKLQKKKHRSMKQMFGIPEITRDETGKRKKKEESSEEESEKKPKKAMPSKPRKKSAPKSSYYSSGSEHEDERDNDNQDSGAEEKESQQESSKGKGETQKAETDEDLFQTPRFRKPSDAAPTPEENVSDDLQEMLTQPMEEQFKNTSDQKLFLKILVAMDLKNPTGFLCCLGDFRKVQTEPLEKVNCKLLLNRTPQSSALFKQLTFHGKMASVAIIKDVLLHLDDYADISDVSRELVFGDGTEEIASDVNEPQENHAETPTAPAEEGLNVEVLPGAHGAD